MDSIVLVALIAGCVSLSNGVLLAMLNRKWRRKDRSLDELTEMKGDIKRLSRLMDRLGAGLNIGLRNDRVIFRAFRENSINGDSELQEKVMDEYFTQCAVDGFRTDREDG
jgi:hypothetical protein